VTLVTRLQPVSVDELLLLLLLVLVLVVPLYHFRLRLQRIFVLLAILTCYRVLLQSLDAL